MSPEDIHDYLLGIAASTNLRLAELLRKNGVISLAAQKGTMYEFLARTVIGQQLSTKAAKTIWERYLQLCEGSPLQYTTDSNAANIRACGISKNKVAALTALTELFIANPELEESLASLPYTALEEIVCEWKGLGPWSAAMLAMFYFRHEDVWPENDAALNRGLRNTGSSSAQIEAFSPYRTYVARHIWQGIDTGIVFDD